MVRLLNLDSPRLSWKEFTLPVIELRWEMYFAAECRGKIVCSDAFFGKRTFILEKKEESDEL